MLCSTVFKQENALPPAEMHCPIEDWYGLAGARQDHADVRRHVVAALGIVHEVIGIFRHEAVEKFFQITASGRIGILHDDDAAAGVLNKHCDCAVSEAALIDL